MQTDTTLLANNTQHCLSQHVAFICMEPQQCWHLLQIVWSRSTELLGPCKRTQQFVGQHHATTLWLVCPFAWPFTCSWRRQMFSIFVQFGNNRTSIVFHSHSRSCKTRKKRMSYTRKTERVNGELEFQQPSSLTFRSYLRKFPTISFKAP